ncbi:MAG: hypothetical protein ACR2RF_08995 [Geminicoccaceae bacterium]
MAGAIKANLHTASPGEARMRTHEFFSIFSHRHDWRIRLVRSSRQRQIGDHQTKSNPYLFRKVFATSEEGWDGNRPFTPWGTGVMIAPRKERAPMHQVVADSDVWPLHEAFSAREEHRT